MKVGGLLHIMLPDSTQARSNENPAKFTDTGIPLMLKEIIALGAVRSRVVAKIAGGSQMFKFANATDIMRVGERNSQAVKVVLKDLNIRIIADDTGGAIGWGRYHAPAGGIFFTDGHGKHVDPIDHRHRIGR